MDALRSRTVLVHVDLFTVGLLLADATVRGGVARADGATGMRLAVNQSDSVN